jgi:hypothetical protein
MESPSNCTKTELPEGKNLVQVCDIAPEEQGTKKFKALLDDGVYYFTLEANCKDV